jgi:hypothetical protein
VAKILWVERAVSTSRSKFQTTAVTGTRKLPSRTSVGIRFEFWVIAVTTMAATQSARPTRNTISQRQRLDLATREAPPAPVDLRSASNDTSL